MLQMLNVSIGYWNVLQAGWLHRDVSIGNVLLMKYPERRDPVKR